MPQCMCIKNDGQRCKSQSTTKSNLDQRFCWQHQQCKTRASGKIFPPTKKPTPTKVTPSAILGVGPTNFEKLVIDSTNWIDNTPNISSEEKNALKNEMMVSAAQVIILSKMPGVILNKSNVKELALETIASMELKQPVFGYVSNPYTSVNVKMGTPEYTALLDKIIKDVKRRPEVVTLLDNLVDVLD